MELKTLLEEHRCKVVYIPDNFFRMVISTGGIKSKTDPFEIIILPTIQGLPQDAYIRAVDFSIERRAITFLCYHESFDPVGPGCHPPEMIVTQEMWILDKQKQYKRLQSRKKAPAAPERD